MTTYRIIHYTKDSVLGTDIHKTNTFNKTELETIFHSLVKQLQPGESAEYMKEDDKWFYPTMMYVENENGKLYTHTATGKRKLSKYN